VLGRGAVLGTTVWDRQHNFRLHVGPLDAAAFESLLPAGSALPAVAGLVAPYVGFEFGWDVRLRVADEAAQPCRLGRRGRLGWTSWLGGRRGGDAHVVIDPEAALRRRPNPRTGGSPAHH
jgi:type VI secretion system protein ImpH